MFIFLNEIVFYLMKYVVFFIILVIWLFFLMVYKVLFLILNYNYFLNVYSYNLVGFIFYIVFFEVKKRSLDFFFKV